MCKVFNLLKGEFLSEASETPWNNLEVALFNVKYILELIKRWKHASIPKQN